MKTAKESYHPYIPQILPCMLFLNIRVVALKMCYKVKEIKMHSYSSEEIFPHQKKKVVHVVCRTSMTSFARACGHILFYVPITIA